jgi:hypothetical protein
MLERGPVHGMQGPLNDGNPGLYPNPDSLVTSVVDQVLTSQEGGSAQEKAKRDGNTPEVFG